MNFDTNMNVPESMDTLSIQQRRLIEGKRFVQMFPNGTLELTLPIGFSRFESLRGIFHYNPEKISALEIFIMSGKGRENEFLELGPFSKEDILLRVLYGEKVVAITEYSNDGTEIRCAVGTDATIPKQKQYFENTKTDNSKIVIGSMPKRVLDRLEVNNG